MNFENFLAYWQDIKKCSPRTISSYRSDLEMFEKFMQSRGIQRVTQLSHAMVSDYIKYMEQQPNPRFARTGLADASAKRRLAALSSYIEYLRATTSPKLRNPLKELTRRWHKNNCPKPVDEETLEQLLAGISILRDRFLVHLFLATGLRVAEMHRLNRDTIELHVEHTPTGIEKTGGTGQVLGKGNKLRTFFVDDSTLDIYADYIESRKDENPALFLSERKTRMSIRAIQYTISAWCKRLGLDHIRVHQLRHSFATRLANADINSLILKDLMGHRSLTTTQGYFKLHETTLAQGYFAAMENVNHITTSMAVPSEETTA